MAIPQTRAYLDVETTGRDPSRHEIIEAAVIRVEPDGRAQVLQRRYSPRRLDQAEPEALLVNGYTPAAWASAREMLRPDAEELRAALTGAVVIGHRVDFDRGFVDAALAEFGVEPLRVRTVDTMSMAWLVLGASLPSLRLADICDALLISNNGAHTALADAQRCRAVVEALELGLGRAKR